MRIVAGKFGSRRIETRKSNDTRPTLDKVREAVFSSLGGMFEGGCVLDLYGGSGAVGLEAVSRGFDAAVECDLNREACAVIRKNIESLHCEDQVTVLCMKDVKALSVCKQKGMKFDLVYLDPPYAKQQNLMILQKLVEYGLLNEEADVVIESDQKDHFEETIGTLVPLKEKEYGITRITYYKNTLCSS